MRLDQLAVVTIYLALGAGIWIGGLRCRPWLIEQFGSWALPMVIALVLDAAMIAIELHS